MVFRDEDMSKLVVPEAMAERAWEFRPADADPGMDVDLVEEGSETDLKELMAVLN